MTENKIQMVNQYEDEISLRDLYLIIKGGFWWILGISLLAAVATFVFFTLRPDVYEAQSTTVITPSSISIENDVGVSFTPQTNVSFEAYRTLAMSQPVLEAVVAVAYDAGYSEDAITLKMMTNDSSVKQLYGPPVNRPESASRVPLSVNHIVKHQNAELAAFLANHWAEESLETIQVALLSALNPVGNVTENQLQDRQKAMDRAEEALRNFNESSNLELIEKQFVSLTDKVSENEGKLTEVGSAISIVESEKQFLDGLILEAKANFEEAVEKLNKFDSQENLTSFETELEKYQAEFSELPFKIRDVEGEIETVKLEVSVLEQQLANMQTAQEQQLLVESDNIAVQLGGVVAQLNERVGPLASGVLNEYELSQVQNDLREKNISLEVLVEQKSLLLSNYDRAVERLPELKTRVVMLQSDRGELLKDVEVMEERRNAVLAKLNQVSDKSFDSRENQSVFKLRQLEIELDAITAQLEKDKSNLLVIQEKRAELVRESERLSLGVENARAAYQEVIRLEPTISYISDLLPASAQILNLSSVPTKSSGRGRLIPTTLTFLIVLAVTLALTLLRNAIAAPKLLS